LIHHKNGVAECPECENKLKDAHPKLAEWYREKVKTAFPSCHISWSFRGKQDQEQAFSDRKSDLHFPFSPHNKSDDQGNPCALALDLFELDFNGIGRWAWGYFRDIAKTLPDCGFPVEWAGNWKSEKGKKLGDFDHFELKLNGDKNS
jgi:hypothetical protein